ncbi:MAG: hypothetical protein U5K53_06280 [Halanaerobiales bacterium]|nr:hypothetical protein [Halanaerobiales bacterium]
MFIENWSFIVSLIKIAIIIVNGEVNNRPKREKIISKVLFK